MFEDNQTFEQFLKDYYAVGPLGYLQYTGRVPDSDLKKILIHTESNYYEYAYMAEAQLMLSINTEIWRLLDKIPITTIGDSYKYTTALGLDDTAIGPGGADAIFGTSTEPTASTIQGITSGVEKIILSRDLHSMIKEKLPAAKQGGFTWDTLKNNFAPKALADKVDKWLGGYETASNVHGVDTPAAKNVECIDRMISNGTESGDSTNHVSAVTDGDIIWDGIGTGSAKIDRSESSGEFSDAQVRLPDSAGTEQAYQILDEIDDLVAVGKKYYRTKNNPRVICLTTNKTLNKVQDEIDPKGRFLHGEMQAEVSINGVSTRPGITAGTSTNYIMSNGIKFPVFTSEALPTLNAKYTTATSGHLYLMNLDGLFLRVDIPVTFLETGFGMEMLHQNYLRSRAMLFTVMQLVCTNFQSQCALKWIKA